MNKTIQYTLSLFMFSIGISRAQVLQPLSYTSYMEKVKQQNLVYAAERLNISITEAETEASKVFSDIQLSVGYDNNEDARIQMGQGYSVEISKTFSFGKRKAGVDLAKSEKELNKALLEDYFRNLQAEVSIQYLEALKQMHLYQVKKDVWEHIDHLIREDSIKYNQEKISQVDALQSRLEAMIIYNEFLQTESELRQSLLGLNLSLGIFQSDTLFVPQGDLLLSDRNFPLGKLIVQALENRADLTAALQQVELAKKARILVGKERGLEFDLSLGVNHNKVVSNEMAPAPAFNGISLGVSVPLKFSNTNKGKLKSAAFQLSQAETLYKQAELEVQTEVCQKHAQYLSLSHQVQNFNKGMLAEVKSVVVGKVYSYQREETSLLEVLNAQHTYAEVHSLYIETLFQHAAALIELEKSAGIWDVVIE